MKYRKIVNNDYSFGNGKKDFYIDSPEAVAQAVETRLRLFKGEWFLDVKEGTLLDGGLLGKTSQEIADAIIQDRALGTEGCQGIDDYQSSFNPDTRRFTASFKVISIYGTGTVNLNGTI